MYKKIIMAGIFFFAYWFYPQSSSAFTEGSHVQTGEAEINSFWSTITFDETFVSTPVVFAQIQTARGADYAQVDIRRVTTTGFDARAEEDRGPRRRWLDGVHVRETVRYIAIDPSTITAGQGIEVGSFSLKQTSSSALHTIYFSESFTDAPIFFVQTQTDRESQTARMDTSSVTQTSAVIRLEEDLGFGVVGWDGRHASETVAYIAIDPGIDYTTEGLFVGQEEVDDQWTSVDFMVDGSDIFAENPVVLTSTQTNRESDTAQTRLANVDVAGFSARLVELTSAGWDGTHVPETVAWIAYAPLLEDYDPSSYAIALVETTSSGVSYIESALIAEGYAVTRVASADIIAGLSLASYDAMVVPGGSDPVYDAMDSTLQSIVQNYVSAGGGYVGICGGAIAGSQTVTLLDYYGVMLDMLGVGSGVNAVYNTGWTSYIGSASPWIQLQATTDHPLFDGLYVSGDLFNLRYYGGPVFQVSSPATTLATYQQDFDSSYSAIGSPAIVESSYGSGKVILFALHPEYDTSSQPLLLNAVQYVNNGF